MFRIPVNSRRLEETVAELEKLNSEKGQILFYGDDWFANGKGLLPVDYVNHSMVDATSEDLLYYYGRLVRPYAPRVLVLCCFGNDYRYGLTEEQVLSNLGKLCDWAKADFPEIQIVILEEQPRARDNGHGFEDRWVNYYHVKDRYNDLIWWFCQSLENVKAVKLWTVPGFFTEDVGNPRKIRDDIYQKDESNLTEEGYGIFKEVLQSAMAEFL